MAQYRSPEAIARYKPLRYEKVKEWRKNTKIKLFEAFGSQCGHCGLVDDPCIFDFHHVDSNSKDFTIANKIASWELLVEESKKCVMLCAHCHRKVHLGKIVLENPVRFDESKIKSYKNYKSPVSLKVKQGADNA